MDDENILNFVAITSCEPAKAAQYLRLTDNNLEQAIQLFFDSPNLDIGGTQVPSAVSPGVAQNEEIVNLDSDDELMPDHDTGRNRSMPHVPEANTDDDENIARRMQEEMYGSGSGGNLQEEVRAPMERRTETLVGPGASWNMDGGDEQVDTLVREQMARRHRNPTGRPGIFNQRAAQTSVWDNANGDPGARRRELASATGGASEQSNKMNMLAELFRPPFEMIFQQSWEKAREVGKELEKWIIVNIQDPAIFDCQRLNRDIWKNDNIKATVRENFIFLQYSKDDTRGQEYINYYFHARDSPDAYPHIAIVDPRTGEQVKAWSGPPIPEPVDFHSQLHEFLDRYSLNARAKNPVAVRKPEKPKVDIGRMTEEEMLELALQNSMGGQVPKDEDPDALTKIAGIAEAQPSVTIGQKVSASQTVSAFDQISSVYPHQEPSSTDNAITTRIQFRGGPGRPIIRRFELTDPVRRIFEWIKADHPWQGKEGCAFELSFTGKNLLDQLDVTIHEAGLKNASVMVEFIED